MPVPRDRLHILAFEPFDGGSHRAVRESITRHSRHAWTWITRPARAWKWRMRLAALELVDEARGRGLLDDRIDAIFATSLLGIPDLIARFPPALRSIPTILYMHENQAAYPAGEVAPHPEAGDRDAHFALTNLASVLTADLTIWNSEWNRRSFREGIEGILSHAPEGRSPAAARLDTQPGLVIWPPVEPPPDVAADAGDNGDNGGDDARVLHKPVRVVWPHRWEHDKGPEELLSIAEEWSEPLDLRWTILGERFRQVPRALAEFERRFAHRIDHMGFEADREDYWRRLRQCDWVLSTARHEFFGIAVVEALLAGCLPWLPARLSYPEILPAAASGLSPNGPPSDPDATRAMIRIHLEPAVARVAVSRIDAAIEQAIEQPSASRARRPRDSSPPP